MYLRRRWLLGMLTSAMLGGCATLPKPLSPIEERALHVRAIEAVKRAATYEHAGSVRAQGIEVLQRQLADQALPWIRIALQDDEPGVRFAALLALGNQRDKTSHANLLTAAQDTDPNVRMAAYFALHRIGDTRFTGRMPALLLNDPSPEVRRNAAFVVGLFDEPGAIALLAKAMKDTDGSVHNQALESMAKLGSSTAIQQLTFWASSGDGQRRVSALNALADLKMPDLEKTFEYKFADGEYIETRLAAARGLGKLDRSDGLRLALAALHFNQPERGVSRDSPRNQIMRVRQLAAATLAAIGDARALRPLRDQLDHSNDPRVQLAAADAILDILKRRWQEDFPWRQATAHTAGGKP